jgi:hypothetical protein
VSIDYESPTAEWDEELGYDADHQDNSQYCQHGTFIGSWWGPDYLCGWCEDGISVAEVREIHKAQRRAQIEKLAETERNVLAALPFNPTCTGGSTPSPRTCWSRRASSPTRTGGSDDRRIAGGLRGLRAAPRLPQGRLRRRRPIREGLMIVTIIWWVCVVAMLRLTGNDVNLLGIILLGVAVGIRLSIDREQRA